MNILYIPLDERPCNYKFPSVITEGVADVNFITPPLAILGNKKKTADIDAIWQFIEEQINEIDYAVVSLDMLLYGGLIPSRLHPCDDAVTENYFNKIVNLKKLNPSLKLFAFQCIMRSPSHDTSEEEPDYYADYGRALHRHAFLVDKKARVGLNKEEAVELEGYVIPEAVLTDYDTRVNFNLKYNLKTVDLLQEGHIDFLVIPQDDSSPFGYTAISQKKVLKKVSDSDLEQLIRVYPGADEVGCSLVARAYQEYKGIQLAIYPMFASTFGPQLVPLYEDRPMNESLKSHIEVTGSRWADSAAEADFVLAYNCPGKLMMESPEQHNKDITYASYRNMLHFVNKIEEYIAKGIPVAVVDSAYANGGDLDLFKYLGQKNLLDKLVGYAGWNTNCNSLGTTLCSSVFNYNRPQKDRVKQLFYRYIEDLIYQANVRQVVINEYLPAHGLSYFVLKGREAQVSQEIQNKLNEQLQADALFSSYHVSIENVSLPWKRMFELDFDLLMD